MMKKPDFLHFDTDSWKLVWLKNVLGQSGLWNILVCGVLKKNSEKPKVTLIIFG